MSEFVLVGRRKRQLTDRMKELLALEEKGLKHHEIADLRGVSKTAVDVMKTKINRRLKINGIYENLK